MPLIETQDLVIVGILIFLEGILSIDNALVLAVLAKHLPKEQQRKALTYGLVGAVVFRMLAIFVASYLMHWNWVKFVGGGYLVFIATRHLFFVDKELSKEVKKVSFWKTVLLIELTDIAFAVDSILAAVALTPKYWIIVTGGVIGLIMMRFAASVFLGLLNRFPGLEKTAYLLVLTIGGKVIIEGMRIDGINFHSTDNYAFWIFWITMILATAYGFIFNKKPKKPQE